MRRKVRTERRSGLPIENPIVFYPRYAWEILSKSVRLAAMYLCYQRRYRRVMTGRSVAREPDAAMKPVDAGELDSLDLFNVSAAARSVKVKMQKKIERKRGSRAVAPKPVKVAASVAD